MNFKDIVTPRGFLVVGGVVLVLLGLLGFVGLTGPTSAQSIFGTVWWFDNAENVAHTVLGVVALLLVYVIKDAMLSKWVTILVGLLALVVGVMSLFGPITTGVNVLGAQLQNPTDTLLHLVVAVWALYAGFMGGKTVVKAA